MKSIIRSILLMEQEKLVVLSEEISFLYDICHFHSNYEQIKSNSSIKQDLESNFYQLKLELQDILEDSINKKFKEIEDILKTTGDNDRELLISIDYYRKSLNSIIKNLKYINQKTSQMFRDGYNQYIPKPTPGRVYSNINVTSQVEQNLECRLNSINKTINSNKSNKDISKISAQIIWDFRYSYNINRVGKSNKMDNKNQLAFFRMSYWYFDLPFLIPALTHELGHISIKNYIYQNKIEELQRNMKHQLHKDMISVPNKDIYYPFINNLPEEIFADLVALLRHGDAYLLTMSHLFLGYYLADNTFDYSVKYKDKEKYNTTINIGPWMIDYKRDHTFLRLSILIWIRENLKNEVDNQIGIFRAKNDQYIQESEELLLKIYNGEDSDIFREYFENWHRYLDGFNKTERFVTLLKDSIHNYFIDNRQWLKNELDRQTTQESKNKNSQFVPKYFNNVWNRKFYSTEDNNNEIRNKRDKQTTQEGKNINNQSIPKYFNDIWRRRFDSIKDDNNKIPHKFEFRKRVHHDTLNRLIGENKLKKDDIIPAELIFYKFKLTDLLENEKEKLRNILINYEDETKSVLGIYDLLKIKEFNPTYTPKLKELSLDHKRYISKISMMKITSDIEGLKKDTSGYSLTTQIEIGKDIKEKDIYSDIYETIKNLYEYFDGKKDIFKLVKIYKSLGPKDIIVQIENINIINLYEIKKYLSQKYQRTFSTISYESNLIEELPDEYKFFTELRLHGKNNINNAIKDDKIKDHIEEVYLLTGVMDYRIIWKRSITPKIIDDLFVSLIGNDTISDMQTRIACSVKL